MKTTLAVAAIASAALSLLPAAAHAAADPQVGHWKLDLVRSRYVTATLPKSSEATLVPYGKDGVSLSVAMVTATGQPAHIAYRAQYDGKRYPRTETGAGAVPGQTVALTRMGPRTVRRDVFLGEKSAGSETWVISPDGKTRTVTQSGVDLSGKPINNLQIYVKR